MNWSLGAQRRQEFGVGCRLRVIKAYEDRPLPVVEHVLTDHYVEIVPYPLIHGRIT